MVRRPGVEPGSTAWKATMLTVTPPTQYGNAPQNYLVNQMYRFFCVCFFVVAYFHPYCCICGSDWDQTLCIQLLIFCSIASTCKSYNCCTCYAILSSLVTRGNSGAVSRRKSRRLVNDHACVSRFLFLIHRLRTTYNFNLGKIKE